MSTVHFSFLLIFSLDQICLLDYTLSQPLQWIYAGGGNYAILHDRDIEILLLHPTKTLQQNVNNLVLCALVLCLAQTQLTKWIDDGQCQAAWRGHFLCRLNAEIYFYESVVTQYPQRTRFHLWFSDGYGCCKALILMYWRIDGVG